MRLIFFAAIILLLSSCSHNRKKLLAGEWKLVSDSVSCTNPVEDSIDAAKRGVFISPEAALAEETKSSLTGEKRIRFYDDGRFEQTDGDGFPESRYELKDSGIIISGGPINLVTAIYTINELSENKLVMTMGLNMRGHSHIYRKSFTKLNDSGE